MYKFYEIILDTIGCTEYNDDKVEPNNCHRRSQWRCFTCSTDDETVRRTVCDWRDNKNNINGRQNVFIYCKPVVFSQLQEPVVEINLTSRHLVFSAVNITLFECLDAKHSTGPDPCMVNDCLYIGVPPPGIPYVYSVSCLPPLIIPHLCSVLRLSLALSSNCAACVWSTCSITNGEHYVIRFVQGTFDRLFCTTAMLHGPPYSLQHYESKGSYMCK